MRVFDTASGRGAMLRCLAILGALIPVIASSQDARLAARIATVRDAAAVRPSNGRSRAQCAPQRTSGSSVDLVSRLSIDEVECRSLTDLNVGRAIAAADGGLAAAGGDPRGRRTGSLAAACVEKVGMLAEQGNDAAARAEFAALDSLTAAEAEPGSRAMLLLERGVVRSRAGEYESGQDDLQRACAILAQAGPPRDSQLCQTHLSNHYRRVGDYDEALRLLQPLRPRRDGRTRRTTSRSMPMALP
ncbi:MAG: tetratricopeptide repeat protein [Gemmatimonadaceae bacterium]